MILFQEQDLRATVPDFESGGQRAMRVLYRVDPLFGHGSRLIDAAKFQPAAQDLGDIVERSGFCPFCADTIASATAPFSSEIAPSGRIIVGNAWAVPNIVAYSTISTVGVYDVSRHFLGLEDLTRDIVYDGLSAMVQHARAVRAVRNDLPYSSINANYLYPAGSSVVHPHLQSSIDPVPIGAQARLIAASVQHLERYGRSYFEELVELEEVNAVRFIARTGSFVWFTPFAPVGFYEVWGVSLSNGEIEELEDHDRYELATGIALVLESYRANGLQSFNFSLIGGTSQWRENGSRLLFRIVARAPLTPYYRSDVTYFERLGQEAMLDHTPEEWAGEVRHHFGSGLV
ncbi:MAG: hypothetical protein ACYDHP_00200 [Ferrimicrobium sp.]